MPEGPRVTDFLNSLAEDPDAERLFEREPVAIMTKFGLTEAQQVLILEGSLGEIRVVITEEIGSDKEAFLMVICIKRH
jgi:hypothetical protein